MKRVADFTASRPPPSCFVNGAFAPRMDIDPVHMEGCRRAYTKRPRLLEHDRLVRLDAPWSSDSAPTGEEVMHDLSVATEQVMMALACESPRTDSHDLALVRQGRYVRPNIPAKRRPSGLTISHQTRCFKEQGGYLEPPAAHAGFADLSTITDAGESETSTYIPLLPPPRSPHKRKARLEAYSTEATRNKSAKGLPSSSPTKDIYKAGTNVVTDAPRVFRVPDLDTSSMDGSDEETVADFPTQRPLGPTPSRWSRGDAQTTPVRTTSIRHSIGFAATPLKIDEEHSLLDAVGPSTPKPSPLPASYDLTPTSFNFGGVSPIGTHKLTMEKGQSASKSWVKAFWSDKTRRRSEPLLNKNLRLPFLKDDVEGPGPSTPAAADKMYISTPQGGATQGSDSTTPIPSYYTRGGFVNQTPAHQKKGEYHIDTRRNLDIFGANASPVNFNSGKHVVSMAASDGVQGQRAAMENLAEMARSGCNGHAKVVILEENNRLVVRFKVSPEYTSMFPESQGGDESHFATSPAAESTSPRITMFRPGDDAQAHADGKAETSMRVSEKDASQEEEVLPEEIGSQRDSGGDSRARLDHMNAIASLEAPMPAHRQSSPSPIQWNQAGFTEDQTLVMEDFDVANGTAETPQRRGGSPTGISLQPSPCVKTPDQIELSGDVPSSAVISDVDQDFEFATPTQGFDMMLSAGTAAFGPPPPPSAQRTPSPPSNSQDTGSPTVRASFTAVNSSPGAHNAAETEEESKDSEDTEHRQTRDYCATFIKSYRNKSKPKRLSTTATGSPIATSPARAPLGAKSPNARSPNAKKDSPASGKRKFDDENSPEKTGEVTEPSPKKARQNIQSKMSDVGITISAPAPSAEEAAEGPGTATKTGGRVDVKTEDGSTMRRSSRLTSKTSIPTSIRINNRSGATALPRPTSSITRNEQVELVRQTTANTRRNRGNAESVEQTLVRCSEELSSEDPDSQPDEPEMKRNKSGKAVSWREPLESCQDEKTKRGRPPGSVKPTQTKPRAGTSKPTATATATAPKAAPSRVAKSLGMVANGTPAKRRHATRASTRGA